LEGEKMIFEGCKASGESKHGIYLEGSGEYVIFSNIVTSCDICNKNIATKMFEWKDKEFQKVLERSHYHKDDWHKVHILGVCADCAKEVVGVV